MAKYNPNLAKINRNYTFEELAKVYGVHKNTITHWVKGGLRCLKSQKPFLVMGSDVREYLTSKRTQDRRVCQKDEFYCMKCKAPSQPDESYVVYVPVNSSRGRLTGLCAQCGTIMNKFTTHRRLSEYQSIFDLTVSGDPKHIMDS